MTLQHMTVRPINARLSNKPRRVAGDIGPFSCRYDKKGIRLSFCLRDLGPDPADDFRAVRRNPSSDYVAGVIWKAMDALWGWGRPLMEFSANGRIWRITKLRVKARSSDA